MKFWTFWDSFNSAIHTNTELSPIDKFNYLLEGPASQVIQKLSLSVTNYEAAVEILQDHFGKTQQMISSHMHGQPTKDTSLQ